MVEFCQTLAQAAGTFLHPGMGPADAHEFEARAMTQVPCTCTCKVNSEGYLRQHFPQRVVFITPRYAESRQRNPELLEPPGARHHGLHALQGLCKNAIQNPAARTPNQGCQKIAGWSAKRHHRNRSPRCSEFESARMSPSKLEERNGNGL